MRSGEGNENCEKRTICLISKKATLHVQHIFFVHFFAVVLHDCYLKLPETPSYSFYEGNVGRVHVHSFFTVAHFNPWGR